mmetsp:Transcript_16992/g.49222  ORF Transcript_16992/g.49222 Transcript_16992/m.49222 type:complete len:402 (+) Transcript_16992:80-1285(+)
MEPSRVGTSRPQRTSQTCDSPQATRTCRASAPVRGRAPRQSSRSAQWAEIAEARDCTRRSPRTPPGDRPRRTAQSGDRGSGTVYDASRLGGSCASRPSDTDSRVGAAARSAASCAVRLATSSAAPAADVGGGGGGWGEELRVFRKSCGTLSRGRRPAARGTDPSSVRDRPRSAPKPPAKEENRRMAGAGAGAGSEVVVSALRRDGLPRPLPSPRHTLPSRLTRLSGCECRARSTAHAARALKRFPLRSTLPRVGAAQAEKAAARVAASSARAPRPLEERSRSRLTTRALAPAAAITAATHAPDTAGSRAARSVCRPGQALTSAARSSHPSSSSARQLVPDTSIVTTVAQSCALRASAAHMAATTSLGRSVKSTSVRESARAARAQMRAAVQSSVAPAAARS